MHVDNGYVMQATFKESIHPRDANTDMEGNFNLRNWVSSSAAELQTSRSSRRPVSDKRRRIEFAALRQLLVAVAGRQDRGRFGPGVP